MNPKLQQFLDNLLPHVMIGIMIAVGIAILFFLSSVILWGLLIGIVLYVFTLIKDKLTGKASPTTKSGKIIEHDEG